MSDVPQSEQPETEMTAAEAGEQPLRAAAEQPEETAPDAEPPERAAPPLAPRPGPRPGPRSGAVPTPAQVHPPAAPAPPVVPPPVAASDPTPWGRVAEDGTVYVRTEDGERSVGSFPDAGPSEALAYFGRKYDELAGQVELFSQRLHGTDVPEQDARRTMKHLREQVAEAHVVGDLAALSARLDALDALAAERRREADRARSAARQEALAARTMIVEEAERVAGTDPERMQWKPAGDRLRELFDTWKEAQQSGPRLDRAGEEALWKRFSHARTTFDRHRRQHFSALGDRQSEARVAKEALVKEAEALSASTEWGPTSTAYRALMDRWKAAGRAARKDDDALWARFRAAQDVFFEARNAANAATDAEFRANLDAKEALLTEAEALLPVTDLGAARAGLRSVQERFEAVGKVPRADMGRVEKRMRTVEEAVRDAEQHRWKRSNPEAKARADSATAQLEESIGALEADVERAAAAGDDAARRRGQEALDARRAWLDQVRRAAQDFSG